MATVTVYTYRCPRCRADIGRRFGLLTTRIIVCHRCGSNVRVDANVVAQNWGYNFAWTGSMVLWAALAFAVLANPEFGAMIGNGTFPADTFEHRLVIAGVSVIWALMGGLVIGGIGMVLGTIVAACASDDGAGAADPRSSPLSGQWPAGGFPFPPASPGQQLSYPSTAGFHPSLDLAASPPRPRERSIFARAFFVLLWPVVFFMGAAIVLNIAATTGVKNDEPPPVMGARTVGLMGSPLGQGPLLAATTLLPDAVRDQPLKQQATENMAAKSAPWLLLGMLIVFILGCVGLLPSTGRKIRRQAASQPAGRVPAQQASSPAWGVDLRNYPIANEPEPQ
jgi:DNA-directed RNA polymerase subunit RPC12/RpoP